MNPSYIPKNILLGINLIPIVIVALLFIGARFCKKKEFYKDNLDLRYTKNLQGFAMLFIMYHHMVQLISSYGWFNIGIATAFNRYGLMFTGIFFFCSGFGLIKSLDKKKDYLKGFIVKRLPSVIIPFYVANSLYIVALRYVLKISDWPQGYSWKAWTGWKLYNNHLWFPIEIVAIYIVFFIVFKLIKKREVAMGVMGLAVIAIVFAIMGNGRDTNGLDDGWFKGEWWYNSTILFVVGMYYCQYKDRIEKLFKKCYPVTIIASIILLIGSDLLAGFAAGKCGYTPTYSNVIMWKNSTLNLLADTFEATCFIMFLIVLTLKVKFNNPIISFLGKISFELYMTHNIFLFLFFNYFKINSQLKIVGLTYVCSIVFAFIVYLVDTGILRLIRVKKKA